MRPLVLVHGFMGGSAQWALQSPLGAERRLIPLDLPGFGAHANMAPISSISGFAAWALEALTEKGVETFDLLGHSMGGMIVQEMARLAPRRINRLVLYGTGPVGDLPGRFEPIEVSMERTRSDGANPTARRIAATWFKDRDAAPEYPACADIAAKSSLAAMLGGLAAMRDWSGLPNLPNITSPTLVLWGDSDRTYDWTQTEQLWQTIPDSQLAVVPGVAHAVHLERPDLFNMIVSGFLGAQ